MAGHLVEGLIGWLRREPWRTQFEELLAEHVGEACDEFDCSIDDLGALLGADRFNVLWGCVFEDFLTLEDLDGRTMVDDYLKRRGFRETATSRTYMTGLRRSVMSLYEVSDIRPVESFLARDLLRGGEPVRVSERSGSTMLRPWDRIAARLVKVGPRTMMGGGVLRFDRKTCDDIIQEIREEGADEAAVGDPAGALDATLAAFAPTLSNIWAIETIGKRLAPPPLVRNTDGHDLVFTTISYPLRPAATARKVCAALDGAPDLRPETGQFWNWIGEAVPVPAREHPTVAGGIAIGSWTEDGRKVLGTLELEGRALRVEVTSAERAERARTLFEPLLAGLVGEPAVTARSLRDHLDAPGEDAPAAEVPDLPPEVMAEALQTFAERYYRSLLDEPIPMLGGQAPRRLTGTEAGREQLVEWLKYMENGSASTPHQPSLAWMWDELGVADRRR